MGFHSNNRHPVLLRVFLFLSLFFFFIVFSVKADTDNTIIFGSDIDYPPLSYIAENQKTGFDADFIKAISQFESINTKSILNTWPEILSNFKDGKIDVVTGIIMTAERQDWCNFTIPYITDSYAIFTSDTSGIKTIKDLPGKKIAILEKDYIIESFLKPRGLHKNLIKTKTFSEAFQLVEKGTADYTIAPFSLGISIIRTLNIKRVTDTGRSLTEIQYRLAVGKENTELLFHLNDIIAQLKDNGTIETLKQKWEVQRRFQNSNINPPSPLFLFFLLLIVAALLIFGVWFFIVRRVIKKEKADLAEINKQYAMVISALPYNIYWKDKHLKYQGGTLPENDSAHYFVNSRESQEYDLFVLQTGQIHVSYDPEKAKKITRLPIYNQDNKVIGVVASREDCSKELQLKKSIEDLSEELAEKNRRIKELDTIDTESGLFNEKTIVNRIRQEIALYERYEHVFSIIMIRIVNNGYAQRQARYDTGKKAIKRFADNIICCIRSIDISGRLEDGTFLVILPHTKRKDTNIVAEKIVSNTELSVICIISEYSGQRKDVLFSEAQEKLDAILLNRPDSQEEIIFEL